MRIETGTSPLIGQDLQSLTSASQGSSLEKLSSGLNISKVADSSSGLSIADKLRTQADSLTTGLSGTNMKIQEAMNIVTVLRRQMDSIDDISVTIDAFATLKSSDKDKVINGISSILHEVDGIAKNVNIDNSNNNSFGIESTTVSLLGGSNSSIFGSLKDLSGDVSESEGSNLTDLTKSIDENANGILHDLNDFRTNLYEKMDVMYKEIDKLQGLGKVEISNSKTTESTIIDVDYAEASSRFQKQNILSQSGNYALAQANQVKSGNVTSLLQ